MDKKVFISGPMTGYPEYNKTAFKEKENELTKKGYSVVNPWKDWLVESDATWEHCMYLALEELIECDYIVYLEGSEKSRGSIVERRFANKLGIELLKE